MREPRGGEREDREKRNEEEGERKGPDAITDEGMKVEEGKREKV